MVFFQYSSFLHQKNWPPWYNWNIVESAVKHYKQTFTPLNCIDNEMVSMLASSVVDHGCKLRSGQTKDYKIGICFAKHEWHNWKLLIWC